MNVFPPVKASLPKTSNAAMIGVSRRRSGPLRRLVRGVLAVIIVLVLLPYAIAPLYLFATPVSTPMLWRWMTGSPVVRTVVPITAVAPVLPHAVIAAEDGRFCEHWGVDFAEIREALDDADDIADARGGSTITQQTAKNLFLWPGRSYVRKALELPLALWIDLVLPKRRIMEIYLNIAEWGPDGEFGIEAGARHAFNKSARSLTTGEASLLAASLPNPLQRNTSRPGPGLRRLARLYQSRVARSPGADRCLRRR